jgi:biopolymer transport protein ExbD
MASLSIKRQRARKRADPDGDPEFQVAPMVDVLLVLMLFFMAITSTEVLKKDKNLKLPDANHAKQDKDKKNKPDELVVNVSWQNETAGFSMDGVTYPTADALEAVLASRHGQNPHAYVLIRADKDVEYSNISDVMNACASAGIGTVSFAVITNPAKAGAVAPAAGGS